MSITRWRWDNVPIPEQHLVALGVGLLAHLVVPARAPIGRRIAALAGGGLFATGIGLTASAVISASRVGVAVDRPGNLVESGAFALGRNPMYQGWTMAMTGLAISTRSLSLLATSIVAAGALHRAILAEEMDLSRAFGEQYAAYRERTPRYATPRGPLRACVGWSGVDPWSFGGDHDP